MPNPNQEPPTSSKAPNEDLKDMDFFAPSKSRYKAVIWIIGASTTSDIIQIMIKMQNPSILESPKSGLKGHGCPLQIKH